MAIAYKGTDKRKHTLVLAGVGESLSVGPTPFLMHIPWWNPEEIESIAAVAIILLLFTSG